MDYKTFTNEVKSHILSNSEQKIEETNYKFYPNGFTSENPEELSFIRNTNIKYNQIESDVLIGDFIELHTTVEDGGDTICRFSVKYLYEEFATNGWERVDEIIRENIKFASSINISEITDKLDQYPLIQDKLFIRPINFTDNRYELKNTVYEQHGDIALVLYVLLYDNEVGIGSMKVSKEVAALWKKELSEVWANALVNTNVMAPPRMYLSQEEVIDPPYTRGAFMAVNSNVKSIGKLFAPIVTTTRKRNGAAAMFYPGVQEKIGKLCGSNYYVAFTSVDDVRIHPENTLPPRRILQSLKDVNKMFNQPADILSRKVFYYDRDKKELQAIEL